MHLLFSGMIKDAKDTFLVPVPQYPLYSAALTLYGGTLVPYFLDEDNGWKIDVAGISVSIAESKQKGLRVRGVVVINPGNPTGQVLSLDNQVCCPRLQERRVYQAVTAMLAAALHVLFYNSTQMQSKCKAML